MSLNLNEISPDEVHSLSESFESSSLEEILHWAWLRFGTRAAIGTSFQGSGLVMIDQALKLGFRFPVFTLDTQLLFPETVELKKRLEEYFGIAIEGLLPDQTPEEQAREHGGELWKRNPDFCCLNRKVFPLQRKLEELSVWITGVRRNQSEVRGKTQILELYRFDELREHYILKLNPMANWSRQAIWDHIAAEGIPYNPLHDQGYRSIGCWPCTKPSGEGEDERAGRWTGFSKTECGIHTFLGSKL